MSDINMRCQDAKLTYLNWSPVTT